GFPRPSAGRGLGAFGALHSWHPGGRGTGSHRTRPERDQGGHRRQGRRRRDARVTAEYLTFPHAEVGDQAEPGRIKSDFRSERTGRLLFSFRISRGFTPYGMALRPINGYWWEEDPGLPAPLSEAKANDHGRPSNSGRQGRTLPGTPRRCLRGMDRGVPNDRGLLRLVVVHELPLIRRTRHLSTCSRRPIHL